MQRRICQKIQRDAQKPLSKQRLAQEIQGIVMKVIDIQANPRNAEEISWQPLKLLRMCQDA